MKDIFFTKHKVGDYIDMETPFAVISDDENYDESVYITRSLPIKRPLI